MVIDHKYAIGILAALALAVGRAGADDPIAVRLGVALLHENAPLPAAVEFHRAALAGETPAAAAACYWAAAYACRRAGAIPRAERLLDLAEDNGDALTAECLLLRAELALDAGKAAEAVFYLNGLPDDAPAALTACARYRLARAHVLADAPEAARAALPPEGVTRDEAARAIADYAVAPRKRPRLGGWLGVVPGLGYAYAGEYANALRSLLLNSLFIYAMVDTADREQWGAFAAITFFEITWYTGSIYGGIDAAHRYNRRTRQTCLDALDRVSRWEPELGMLPTLQLQISF
jgi:hypothetical protein